MAPLRPVIKPEEVADLGGFDENCQSVSQVQPRCSQIKNLTFTRPQSRNSLKELNREGPDLTTVKEVSEPEWSICAAVESNPANIKNSKPTDEDKDKLNSELEIKTEQLMEK